MYISLLPHFLPALFYKRTWHPDPDKMLILPSSWSASSLNKFILFASKKKKKQKQKKTTLLKDTKRIFTIREIIPDENLDLQKELRVSETVTYW